MTRPPSPPDDCIEWAFCDPDVVAMAWEGAGAVAGEALELEERASSPEEALVAVVRLLGNRGLLGLTVPGAWGGTYDTVRSIALCLVRERLAYVSPLVELAFAMQGLGSYAISRRGSEPLRNAWLPRVAAGEAIAALALTEDDAGSDLSRIATQARLDGAEYVVEGAKTFISNAGIADFYTVVAATAPPGTARRLSAFVVPAEADGVRTRPIAMLGGHPIGRVEFAGVRIPAWHRIGEEGDGLAIALEVLTKFRPTVGAAAVGFAQRALDETLCHVRSREQFGGPLSDLQAVQVALADMACEIEGSRLLVYRAAAIADAAERQNGADGERQIRANGAEPRSRRSRVVRTASMAKLVATEAAFRVIDRAVQLHGGRGLLQGGVIARLYQDVRALRIYEGASEIQRLLITRELFR